MTSGVFFRRFAPGAGFADPFQVQVPVQQLTPAFTHRVRVHADEIGDALISAVAEFERLQSSVQAALSLVQRAEEEHDCRFDFVRDRFLFRQTAGQPGLGLKAKPGLQLTPAQTWIGRAIQIKSADGFAGDPLLLNQPQQGFFGRDMQQAVQFFGEIAAGGPLDEGFRRV